MAYFDDSVWMGIIDRVRQVLIVANVDNLCRIILMKKINTHPLIVIFGVILLDSAFRLGDWPGRC